MHLALCFVGRNTVYTIPKTSLLRIGNFWENVVLHSLKLMLSADNVVSSTVVCSPGLSGENNSVNSFPCLGYVSISSCPVPCLFICPASSSSKNAFYMRMMIINLCKSIWISCKGAELEEKGRSLTKTWYVFLVLVILSMFSYKKNQWYMGENGKLCVLLSVLGFKEIAVILY